MERDVKQEIKKSISCYKFNMKTTNRKEYEFLSYCSSGLMFNNFSAYSIVLFICLVLQRKYGKAIHTKFQIHLHCNSENTSKLVTLQIFGQHFYFLFNPNATPM